MRSITKIRQGAVITTLKTGMARISIGYGSFEPEYVAILNRGTALGYPLPSAVDQSKQNSFLKALKDLGIWSPLTSLYVFKNAGSLQFASIDWKLVTRQATYTGTGLSLVNSKGIKCDGVSGMVDTNYFVPNVTAQINQGAYFSYFGDGIAGGIQPVSFAMIFGSQGNQFDGLVYNFAGFGFLLANYQVANNTLTYSGFNLNTAGLYLIQKKLADFTHLISNGTDQGAKSNSNNWNGSTTLRMFARNLGDCQGMDKPAAMMGVAAGNALVGLESALKTATDNFYSLG
jgi:hypothetical protein